VVADGRLGPVGTPAAVITTAMLRDAFGVRAVVAPNDP